MFIALQQLIVTRQLSIYIILGSLVITAAMMRPSASTLIFAVPINAAILFILRWVAHREGERF